MDSITLLIGLFIVSHWEVYGFQDITNCNSLHVNAKNFKATYKI